MPSCCCKDGAWRYHRVPKYPDMAPAFAANPTSVPHQHTISAQGQVRLLELSYTRLVYSICATPFVAMCFGVWAHLCGLNTIPLGIWTASYAAAALIGRGQYRQFVRDRTQLDAAPVLARWLPLVHKVALAHGLGLALSAVCLLVPAAPFEMILLLYFSLAASVAANATHQTPMFSVFQRFFVAGWGGSVALIPLCFPAIWVLGLALALGFTITIFRHAKLTHQFFVKQIFLEEEGSRLAERYREAKDQAEAALAEKNRFLSTAAHDLRQPVHAMSLLTEAVAQRNHDPALTSALTDLRRSQQSVQLMFNSLLDLSRIESGQVAVHPQSVDLARLFEEISIQFSPEAQARGLALRIRTVPTGTCVHADPALLRQSIANLVHNALRYTLRGGVLLGVRRRGMLWRIEVWDTGLGVALEDQAHIYQPFYRPQHAWHINRAGHGLGLAVVARCAVLMHAQHGLQSRLGQGSCFWLQLPTAATVATVEAPPPNAVVSRLQGHCLVVDDDPHVLSAWAELLAVWGVHARLASDAREAFAHVDAGFIPQAVLCDQRLRSGESGFDVLRALLAQCPDAHGAMVSGEFDSPELQEAEAEGYLVLRKPLDAAALYAVLAQWLPTSATSDPDPDPVPAHAG